MKDWLPNAICFQLVWVAAVGGAANGWWWAGPAALAAFAAWQLPLSRTPRADVILMLGAALIGFALDSAWVRYGLMRFSAPLPWVGLAPVWIVSMWMGFALTLNHSMSALKHRLWLAAILGVVGGPLAYAVADRAWSAVDLADPHLTVMVALAISWGVVTPLLLRVARHFDPTPPAIA